MARKKAAATAEQPSGNTATESQAGQPEVTKLEAVRQALAELGKNAMPKDIQDYVMEKFAMDITLNLVNSYKHHLTKKKKGKRQGRKERAEEVKAEPKAPTVAENGKSSGAISLQDIQAVKELTERVGAGELHALIDMLAR